MRSCLLRLTLTQRLLVVSVVALCVGLLLYPMVTAFLLWHPHAIRIAVFTVFASAVLTSGLSWITAHRDLRRPAEHFHPDALVLLLIVTALWAMVIADSGDASYFLIALALLASWLLPLLTGAVTTITLAGFTVAGQVVHHGLTAGAVVGPLLVAALIVGFVATLRLLFRSYDASQELLSQLRAMQEQAAAAEREAGRLAERTRLGRDLHDTVAQSLSSIQLLLQAAERAKDPEQVRNYLALARQTASESLAETRAFIGELSPPGLVVSGLIKAIRRAAKGCTCPVRVEVEGQPRTLPARVETALFRIAQEALHNVERHANATSCTVRLAVEPAEVALEIDDDGAGFDVDAVPAKHYGLVGMISRAEELDGQLTVVSSPGDGTLVAARVPIPGGQA